jgi:hypothetical protein
VFDPKSVHVRFVVDRAALGIFDSARNFERNMQVRYNQSSQLSVGSEEATEVRT